MSAVMRTEEWPGRSETVVVSIFADRSQDGRSRAWIAAQHRPAQVKPESPDYCTFLVAVLAPRFRCWYSSHRRVASSSWPWMAWE